VPQNSNREEELSGGLKNALERGETIDSAKQSFINAGYKPLEVEAAVQKVPMVTSQISRQVVVSSGASTAKSLTSAQEAVPFISQEKKELSKKFKIILAIVSVAILISAAVLGFFWNKLF